ncbi:hypothetical protein BKA70DRAFT_1308535 [Coprinopsis sp. MPI-PUGE-AT-0042]|nr:hypothetical protein BKA70DRAFT_1308535 [Coprinopsis sp. MPI-PUGE-AT-0042]
MPAEPTKAKLKRRSSRKDLGDFGFDGTHARELELKRTRGRCAECRRLKIKCDKQIPCQSCVRRGCVTLCPNGSLATGQGTRFVLAATEHLHNRIAKLNSRIRQLEDALQSLQSQHSIDPHPLLHKDLLFKEEPEQHDEQEMKEVEVQDETAPPGEIVNAFGTLSVSDNGVTRFFGPTGGSESGSASKDGERKESTTPPDADSQSATNLGTLALFSRSFPFTPVGQPPQIQEMIESNHLPTYDDAVAYLEIYFAQVMDDMLPVIYKRRASPNGEDYSSPHDLALLFTMFAVACFVGEDDMKPYSDHFFQIARVALSLRPILEKPSMVTIQTLDTQSIYIAMSGGGGMNDEGGETSMETRWSMITLASNLSQTVHRDSTKWGLSPKIVQRRSILFWDLFVSDVWQVAPPSFSLAYVDTPFPKYEDAGNNPAHAFEVWQARFAAEVVMEVAAKTLTTESPSYSTIMSLDRKIREFPNPASMSESNANFSNSSQRNVLDHVREAVLLYIHRSFFAQAIIEHPENPLKSPYAPSFLAAYKASTIILEAVQDQFDRWPKACAAFWTMWTFAFSAAVVFGTVVTRGPRSPLAKTAMRELEKACILFSKTSPYSIRAARALPVLKKLADKARMALNAAQDDPSGDAGAHWSVKQEDTEDELSIFMGRTRFVNTQRVSTADSNSSSLDNSKPLADRAGPSSTLRAAPPTTLYQTGNSQPVTLVDVSMHGAAAWQSAEGTYEGGRASPGYDARDYNQGHAGGMALPTTSRHPTRNYPWENTSIPQQYDEAPRAEMSRPRQYSINPSGHHDDQYYDSGPSTVPTNQRSQAYYSQPAGYAQPTYAANTSHPDTSSRMGGSSSYMQPPPSAANPQYSNYHQSSHDSYAPAQHEGGYGGYHMYPTTPAFHPGAATPANPALEEMGIVSRDSRLDQRWGSFVSDTGILDGYNSYR